MKTKEECKEKFHMLKLCLSKILLKNSKHNVPIIFEKYHEMSFEDFSINWNTLKCQNEDEIITLANDSFNAIYEFLQKDNPNDIINYWPSQFYCKYDALRAKYFLNMELE